jgi:hypothetical protein
VRSPREAGWVLSTWYYLPSSYPYEVMHNCFRELKNRTKRFHNNVNSKTLKSIEEIAIVEPPLYFVPISE